MAASAHIKAMANWLEKIAGLKKLLADVGPLWPRSTKLAGFSVKAPSTVRTVSILLEAATAAIKRL